MNVSGFRVEAGRMVIPDIRRNQRFPRPFVRFALPFVIPSAVSRFGLKIIDENLVLSVLKVATDMNELMQQAEPEIVDTVISDRHADHRNIFRGPKRGPVEIGSGQMLRDCHCDAPLGKLLSGERRTLFLETELREFPQKFHIDCTGPVDALKTGLPGLAKDMETPCMQGMLVGIRIRAFAIALTKLRIGERIPTAGAVKEIAHDLFRAILQVICLVDQTLSSHLDDWKTVEIDSGRRFWKPVAVRHQDLGVNA